MWLSCLFKWKKGWGFTYNTSVCNDIHYITTKCIDVQCTKKLWLRINVIFFTSSLYKYNNFYFYGDFLNKPSSKFGKTPIWIWPWWLSGLRNWCKVKHLQTQIQSPHGTCMLPHVKHEIRPRLVRTYLKYKNHPPFFLYLSPYCNPLAYSLRLTNWQVWQSKQECIIFW